MIDKVKARRNCFPRKLEYTIENSHSIDLFFTLFCSLSVPQLIDLFDDVLELITRRCNKEFVRDYLIVEGDHYSGHGVTCLTDRVTVDLKGK